MVPAMQQDPQGCNGFVQLGVAVGNCFCTESRSDCLDGGLYLSKKKSLVDKYRLLLKCTHSPVMNMHWLVVYLENEDDPSPCSQVREDVQHWTLNM